LLHFLGDVISPGGNRGKLTILVYHRVPREADPMLPDEIDAEIFCRHMTLLAREFNVLALGEASERLSNGTLPARAVSITFDDGYADNEEVALPILKRLGLRATFFVATGFCEGGIMFNDGVIEAIRRAQPGTHDLTPLGLGNHLLGDARSRRAAADALIGRIRYRPVEERSSFLEPLAAALRSKLPATLMMTPSQIKRVSDEGMEVGGHTVNHPILSSLDESRSRAEIEGGKRRLEEITGRPVNVFAYPNGKPGRDYGPREVALVRQAGFTAAVSTIPGAATRFSDSFQLPRFGSWDRTSYRFGIRLLLMSALGSRAHAVTHTRDAAV